MGLASYTELKAAVARRLGRSGDGDLAAELDDYIDLAEARFQRELRLRAQEQRATATVTGAYLDLPTDFLELRNIQLNSDPLRSLECVSPEMIDRNYPQARTGEPPRLCHSRQRTAVRAAARPGLRGRDRLLEALRLAV
jgi:hypothetical protein